MSAMTALRPELADLPPAAPALAEPGPSLLRFITCGSVDDGKSTLIGRLLYDSKSVLEDHLSALRRDSRKYGTQGDELDFALLVDGLAAEREQGITIDVAYRAFATRRRSFIVADTPGHEQYTRNMATGASTAELAIILVDARKGILPQTRRHAFIVSLLGVRHVVLAVNKMDLVDYSRRRFEEIVADFKAAAAMLAFDGILGVPVSALRGDNIAQRSDATPWYRGPHLLGHLESVEVGSPSRGAVDVRLPVQWVNRPDSGFRGYSGTIASGYLRAGDEIMVLPSRQRSRVADIHLPSGPAVAASAGQAVTVTLADDIDVSRGDALVSPSRPLPVSERLSARLIWTDETAHVAGRDYVLKLASREVRAVVKLRSVIDIHTYAAASAPALRMNEAGLCDIVLAQALPVAPYREDRIFGSFILIDRSTHATVALGVVEAVVDAARVTSTITRPGLIASFGAPGSARRQAFWTRASWRLGSAMVLGGTIWGLTGSFGLACGIALGDAAVRPLLSVFHVGLWTRFGKASRDLNEGGAGI